MSYSDGQADKVELHVIGDSSQNVFSSVAFLRRHVTSGSHSRTQLAFVFGKARVAATKPLTISKVELQAALLAARLRNKIRLVLTTPVERTFLCTDSTTTLQWLQSTDYLPVFVANRVAKILVLTTTNAWNYVQTSENPTDFGTHGLSAQCPSESHWLKHPDFLKTENCLFQPSADVLQKIKRTSPNRTKIYQNLKNKKQRHLPQMSLTLHQLASGRSIARTSYFCTL